MSVKYFEDINTFLETIGIPLMTHQDFYIVKFEDHNYNINSPKVAYKHDYFEISFTIGYNALVSIEDKTRNTLDYNLSFTSPGQTVRWEMNEDVPKDSLSFMILFKSEFLPFINHVFNLFETFPFFNNFTRSSYQLNQEQITMFTRCFYDLYQENVLDNQTSIPILQSYLTALLFKAKRELKFSEKISYLKSRREEITYNFEHLIKQTKKKHQPIKYFADLLHISPIYLSECIKKTTDKTAKQMIDEYIVLEAKSLLKQSTCSIYEVAYTLGFEDDSNFVKYFKKQTGLTPKQFKIYGG